MRGLMTAAVAALLAAGCGTEAPPPPEPEAAELSPGLYEASWTVSELRSIDKTTPSTNLKQDATGTSTGCIGPEGAIDTALFAEDGDSCTASNAYVRNGRISIDVSCEREGASGPVRQSVSGTYTSEGLEAEVSTTTYLAGPGDYAMVRTFTARRVGECPPAAETTGNVS